MKNVNLVREFGSRSFWNTFSDGVDDIQFVMASCRLNAVNDRLTIVVYVVRRCHNIYKCK
ncbi:hypothetical protein ACWXWU_16900 [Shewanella sp. A14]